MLSWTKDAQHAQEACNANGTCATQYAVPWSLSLAIPEYTLSSGAVSPGSSIAEATILDLANDIVQSACPMHTNCQLLACGARACTAAWSLFSRVHPVKAASERNIGPQIAKAQPLGVTIVGCDSETCLLVLSPIAVSAGILPAPTPTPYCNTQARSQPWQAGTVEHRDYSVEPKSCGVQELPSHCPRQVNLVRLVNAAVIFRKLQAAHPL